MTDEPVGPTAGDDRHYYKDGKPIEVACPVCMKTYSLHDFYVVNPRLGVYDNRIRKSYYHDNPRRRGRPGLKRATRRPDGMRRMTFYVDFNISGADIAAMLYQRYGLKQTLYPRTRGTLIQFAQDYLTSNALWGATSAPQGVLDHVYSLIPDLQPDYLKRS